MNISAGKRGSMMILMLAITLAASLVVPYLYLDHIRQKKINITNTVCREALELVGAVNDHYMSFIKQAGAYIDLIEQDVRDIKVSYYDGNITRQAMKNEMDIITSGIAIPAELIVNWKGSGNAFLLPTGSESSATFISRLDIGDEVNGNIGDSETVRSVTIRSGIEASVSLSSTLYDSDPDNDNSSAPDSTGGSIPQRWWVEITIVPDGKFDLATLRKNLFGGIKNSSSQTNECIKTRVLKAEEEEAVILIEYSISGILEDNLSIFGM